MMGKISNAYLDASWARI